MAKQVAKQIAEQNVATQAAKQVAKQVSVVTSHAQVSQTVDIACSGVSDCGGLPLPIGTANLLMLLLVHLGIRCFCIMPPPADPSTSTCWHQPTL
eukprot:1136802-Pelagomonas_calceolata.AAC.2